MSMVLEDLRQHKGSEEPNVFKAERKQSLEIFKKAKKEYDVAVASTYELLCNLLSGDAQTQWDRIERKMHKRDSWAGVNGVVTKGQHPRSWVAFKDCTQAHGISLRHGRASEVLHAAERKEAHTCHYTSI